LSRKIQTYGREGVGKPGREKHSHSIIYTGRSAPQPTEREVPGRHEEGMLPSVRVTPLNKHLKLDSMSRINYSKVFSIDLTVRVRDFGLVDEKFLHVFRRNFATVIQRLLVSGEVTKAIYSRPSGQQHRDNSFGHIYIYDSRGKAQAINAKFDTGADKNIIDNSVLKILGFVAYQTDCPEVFRQTRGSAVISNSHKFLEWRVKGEKATRHSEFMILDQEPLYPVTICKEDCFESGFYVRDYSLGAFDAVAVDNIGTGKISPAKFTNTSMINECS
jgi:hypothetical protein